MNETNRSTGKTFRAILQALLAASESENVILVVRNSDMALHVFSKTVYILQTSHVSYTCGDKQSLTLEINGGGSISVVGEYKFNQHAQHDALSLHNTTILFDLD